jgi:hypothetical protein
MLRVVSGRTAWNDDLAIVIFVKGKGAGWGFELRVENFNHGVSSARGVCARVAAENVALQLLHSLELCVVVNVFGEGNACEVVEWDLAGNTLERNPVHDPKGFGVIAPGPD